MRTPDKLEARARELSLLDGHDPDKRVPYGPNGRTQPAWCAYRERARTERNLAAQAAADEAAKVMPQPDQYKNAPLTVFGEHQPETLAQMNTCMQVGNVVAGAICADGHLGYAQPVGAVIAYDKQVSISGVGYDIACGNLAVRLDVPFSYAVQDRANDILQEIRKNISFGIGQVNNVKQEHELFDDLEAWKASDMEFYKDKARAQLGTVGSGNHYIDLFHDEEGFVWIGVHFGSRGLGHTTATKYLKAAGGKDGISVPPAVVDEDSEIGRRYLAGMELAGRYAYAGREWVVDRVNQIIGGHSTKRVHNHHNYAWYETVGDKKCWVVRKGCTPAWPNQPGFIGGSMAENAVIVKGALHPGPAGAASLFSTVHGAGRNFGRKEAKRRFTREEMEAWLRKSNVILSGGDLDESPMAYKRLSEVLDFHHGTVDIQHTLKPFAVAMAGAGDFDPWKD